MSDQMRRLLENLTGAAEATVEVWENGDLAGAVNVLEADADAARKFLSENPA